MSFGLRVSGVGAVLRAFSRLPAAAQRETQLAGERAAQDAARRARSAGLGDSRQSARVARTVHAEGATVRAGGSGKAAGLVFGSEFGGRGRYGWYAHRRYQFSRSRQFRRPAGSYWFLRSVDGPDSTREYETAADEIVGDWGRG